MNKPGPKKKRLPYVEVRRAYEGGATIHDIAISYGVSYGTARARIQASGATLRPHGARSRRHAALQAELQSLARLADNQMWEDNG